MDMVSKTRRSEIMSRITGKNTIPEVQVRKLLHGIGLRFRLHCTDLPGKPDIVLRKQKTVVFVHGCFWHCHGCKKGSKNRRPKSNKPYWNKKLARNAERDVEHAKRLRTLGWRRIVVWACETAKLEKLERRLRKLFGISPAAGSANQQ